MKRPLLMVAAGLAVMVVLGLGAYFWMEDAVENPLSCRILEGAPGENGQLYIRYEARNESRFPVDGVFLMKLRAFDGVSEREVASSEYAGPGRLRYGDSFTDWMHSELRNLPEAEKLSFTYQWTPVTRGRLRDWLLEWTFSKPRPEWLTPWAHKAFYPKDGRSHPVTTATALDLGGGREE